MKKLLSIAAIFALAGVTACGGGDQQAANSDTAVVTTTTTTPAPDASTSATPAAPAGAAAAITGTTHEVKMIGDEKGYRFEPANITIKAGDGVKWVMVTGGPHNVSFDPATLPAGVKSQLVANMPNQISELSSPMLMTPNEGYTVSFAGVKPGTYNYICTPHLAMNMKGQVTVQ